MNPVNFRYLGKPVFFSPTVLTNRESQEYLESVAGVQSLVTAAKKSAFNCERKLIIDY